MFHVKHSFYEEGASVVDYRRCVTFHVKQWGAKMIKGVIFDFNGTLYFDEEMAEGAFHHLFREMGYPEDNFTEMFLYARRNPFSAFLLKVGKELNRTYTEAEKEYYIGRLSHHYRKSCRESGQNGPAPGAAELLDQLKEKGYKLNLCTATVEETVDFYYEHTGLGRWFDRSLTAFDDGVTRDKKEMYRQAAENIGLDPKDCLVFEDSLNCINDAITVGYERFIYVNHYGHEKAAQKEVLQEIKDYHELDRSLFTEE